MTITVSGRKFNVSDSLRAYAEEKIGSAAKVMDIQPFDVEVTLYTQKNSSNPKKSYCEVTLYAKSHIIRVEECDEDMYAAIDIAAAKVVRQLRKYKTRVVDRRVLQGERDAKAARIAANVNSEINFDELLDDMYAEEDAVVRVKTIEFAPLTEEEALIQIDLLGHDFFAYTDRDTGAVCILYRREAGGYGLLKQDI